MRPRIANENTLLNTFGRAVTARVEIQNASGTWKNYSNLTRSGFFSNLDFVRSLQWGTDIDAPTWTGKVTLAASRILADGSEVSISPYMEMSPANVDDGGAPASAITGMRRIRWYTTMSQLDASFSSEHKVFDGYVTKIRHSNDLELTVSDLGHLLVITQIKDERIYEKGVLLGEALQAILDNTMGVGVIPLTVDPALAAVELSSEFKQDRVKVMEAIRNLAFKTVGANVRYLWSGEEMVLTAFMPPRTKTVPDFSYDKQQMFANVDFVEETEDVRNSGRLYYQDADKKAVVFVEYTVPASITKYKERYFEFKEPAVSEINTEVEAKAYLKTAIDDLAQPKAEKKYDAPYNWASDVYDLYTLVANNIHYSTSQLQAVSSVNHNISRAIAKTTFGTRGNIAGFSHKWIAVEGGGPVADNNNRLVVGDGMTPEGSMYGGELFNGEPDGCMWLHLKIGKNIRRVHVWARQTSPSELVVLWPPTSSDMYKAVTLDRPEGRIPREGNFTYGPGPYEGRTVWSIIVPIPTIPGQTRTVIVQGEDYSGNFGPQSRYQAVAADSPGSLEVTGFTSISITRPSATTIRVSYTPVDPVGTALFFRDGIMIDYHSDVLTAGAPVVWNDEELHADKQYKMQVMRLSNGRSSARTIALIPAWTTSLVFANGTPALYESGGQLRVRIEAGGLPVGTTHIRVEKSRDSGHYDPWTVATTLPVASFPFYDVVVIAGQGYRLVALNSSGAVLDTSQPVYWTNPLGMAT